MIFSYLPMRLRLRLRKGKGAPQPVAKNLYVVSLVCGLFKQEATLNSQPGTVCKSNKFRQSQQTINQSEQCAYLQYIQ